MRKQVSRAGMLVLSLALSILTGCAAGPDPVYEGPAGTGRLVYDPDVGITREGADRASNEQLLYAAAVAAFRESRWDECIQQTRLLTSQFPEGSRAVDALLLRIRANLEAARPERGPLPRTVSLDRLLFLYLAPVHDERIQLLLRGNPDDREFVVGLRSRTVQEFLADIEGDAIAAYNSGRLDVAQRDVNTLTTYYLPALQLREYRRQVAELARDVCWLMFAARDNNRTILVSEDLLAVNPPPNIKADTLFVMAYAQQRNGAHPVAASTFGHLYRGAGLRDTDTRWRPFALLGQIDQTLQTSKGFIYDLTYYERALELLGEYELYRFENPNISPALHDQFVLLFEYVYQAMIDRELNAADTYARLGERAARDYHRGLAGEWRLQRDRRIASLASDPG